MGAKKMRSNAMDTNAKFIAYAKKQFDADLAPSKAWAKVGHLDLNDFACQEFVKDFIQAYPHLVRDHPDTAEVARPLFFGIAHYAAKQPPTRYWWLDIMDDVVLLWTTMGVRDMSHEEADVLAPLLRARLQQGEYEENIIGSMLLHSPLLWERLGEETIEACRTRIKNGLPTPGSRLSALLHRYRPQETMLMGQDALNAYGAMCGWFKAVQPTLVEMRAILMPQHHCALAWSVAMENCETPKHGDWIELMPVFASLRLCPDDKFAWAIFAHLEDNARSDASCAQLVQALGSFNPKMEKAYLDLWPAVTAMYDKHARNAAAAALWKSVAVNKHDSLELPSLGLH